jgi:hypothetical protein
LAIKLNAGQHCGFYAVLELIARELLPSARLCISGLTGVGTPSLIRAIAPVCIANKVPLPVTAPTGVAACLIDGQKFHSTFQLSDNHETAFLSLAYVLAQENPVNQVRLVIDDEMIIWSGDIFQTVSDSAWKVDEQDRRPVAKQSIPFAGIPIVRFGVLFQILALTPAKGEMIEAHLGLGGAPLFETFFSRFLAESRARTCPRSSFCARSLMCTN